MAVKLLRTETVIEQCHEHLEKADAGGTEIEAYLTQYILIVFCAEVEQTVRNIIGEIADQSGDHKLATFTRSSLRHVLRGIKKENLSHLIALFDENNKERWENAVAEQDITRYSSAVLERHKVAHAHGASLTLHDIEETLSATYRVLDSFKETLDEH